MRINKNTDVNAFYLFPTRYGLKLASILGSNARMKVSIQVKKV